MYIGPLSVEQVYWYSAPPVGSGNISIVSQRTHTLARLLSCFERGPCWLSALQDVE